MGTGSWAPYQTGIRLMWSMFLQTIWLTVGSLFLFYVFPLFRVFRVLADNIGVSYWDLAIPALVIGNLFLWCICIVWISMARGR